MTNEKTAIVPAPPTQIETLESAEKLIDSSLQLLAQYIGAAQPEQLPSVYGQLKSWEENLGDLSKSVRGTLLAILRNSGEVVTDAGTLRAQIGEYQVEARPQKTGLDKSKVQALFLAKGININEWMQKTIVYDIDQIKIDALLEQGEITRAELDTCRPEKTWALQRPKKSNQ